MTLNFTVKVGNILGRAVRHERLLMGFGLLVVVVLAWAYLLSGAGTMQEMGGMMMPMSAWPWTFEHALLMFIMWLAMMTAMMLPSASPAIMLFATLVRRSETGTFGPSAPILFVLGYLFIWAAFSLVAVFLQFLLERAALLSAMMESTSMVLSGAILICAGIYQLTALKRSCLSQCRSPLEFLATHWRMGNRGAFAMGVHHGTYCLGCCWALMLLLFVGGIMNLLWAAGLAIVVFLEKLAPGGQWIGKALGVPLVAAGTVLLGTTAGRF